MLSLIKKILPQRSNEPASFSTAPELLTFSDGQQLSSQQALCFEERFCYPSPTLAPSRYGELRGFWLQHLCQCLGSDFKLAETNQDAILSKLSNDKIQAAFAFFNRPRKRIENMLTGLAEFDKLHQQTLIVFPDEHTYYQYLSWFYPEARDAALPTCLFVNIGIPHYVTTQDQLYNAEGQIANHLLNLSLPSSLPRWLHDGIISNVQRKISSCQSSCRCAPPAYHQQHLSYWNLNRIQQFWAGSLFSGEEQDMILAQDMARIMVNALAEDWSKFIQFAQQAQIDDAGQQAAIDCLEVDLMRLVCAILEQEPIADWAPKALPLQV